MIEALLLRLRARDEVSAAEEQVLRRAVEHSHEVPPGTIVGREGREVQVATLLIDGFMCRYKMLGDGKRQILELQVAGDFMDLHGFTLKRLDYSVMALGPCRIAHVPHARLRQITQEHAHLTRLLWFTTNLDAAAHRSWVLSLGRRLALPRLAHLFCELHLRLQLAGRVAADDSYPLPLTQIDLSDCLGTTPVHVNRTMQMLRETGFADFRSGVVHIHDMAGLHELAGFDPQYLYLNRAPL